MNKNGKNFYIVTSIRKMTFKAFISLCFLKIKVMFLVTQLCTVGLNNNVLNSPSITRNSLFPAMPVEEAGPLEAGLFTADPKH